MIPNQLKTVLLLGGLTGLLLVVGQLVGGMSGLAIALIFAIGMNGFSYFFSDKLVLAMYKAKPVTQSEHPRLYSLVRDVITRSKLPMPKVYIIPSASPNAFATGRNPDNAVIACTTGILELLNDDELKGVLAHEAAHIKNRDILISTIAAAIAGVISYVATMAQWAAIFGFGGRDRDSNILHLLALIIITPLIATILQLAVSRSREYLADETGAKTLHNPHGLAAALSKLETGIKHHPMRMGSESTAALFIANPFSMKGITSLFSTHPPLDKRINRLKKMRV